MKRFEFIAPDDLVFDIGANMGNKTAEFLALGANVVAVEPQGACITELHKRFRAHIGTGSLKVVQGACGSHLGEVWLSIGEAHTLSTISREFQEKTQGRFGLHKWLHRIPVQSYTLSHLMKQHGVPKFIKIDVEGYEYEVLKGMDGIAPQYISFEYTPELHSNFVKCCNYLQKVGNWVFNYGSQEAELMKFTGWVDFDTLNDLLLLYSNDKVEFGDVYAKQII